MAAEIHGLLHGYDQAVCIQHLLNQLLGFNFEIHVLIDSKTLFNVVTKEGPTLEKRLQINVWEIRESFSNGKLKTLSWIPSHANIADALTKQYAPNDHALIDLMKTNTLDIEQIGWARKDIISKQKSGSVKYEAA